jgi:hypothetical protein
MTPSPGLPPSEPHFLDAHRGRSRHEPTAAFDQIVPVVQGAVSRLAGRLAATLLQQQV